MREIIFCSEVFGFYYIDFKFKDSKRVSRAKVHSDEKGEYFKSGKEKYYLSEVYESLKEVKK